MDMPEQRLRRIVDANGGRLSIEVKDLLDEFELASLSTTVIDAIHELLLSVDLTALPSLAHVGLADSLTLSTEQREAADAVDPTNEFRYWVERAVFHQQQLRESRARIQTASQRCKDAGVDEKQLSGHVKSLAGPAAAGGGGGFLAFGYAESGPDLDADGDVDGGLFDFLGDLF